MNFVDPSGMGSDEGLGLCSVHMDMFAGITHYTLGRLSFTEFEFNSRGASHNDWVDQAIHFMREMRNPDIRGKQKRRFFWFTKEGQDLIEYMQEVDPAYRVIVSYELTKKSYPKYLAFCQAHNLTPTLSEDQTR
jgi:hypothetical protein